uniref:Mpv17-like protein n=2 Tax=Stomoxys calcitrans TaxID=35570 RepID=A0A1I8PYF2_STOCA
MQLRWFLLGFQKIFYKMQFSVLSTIRDIRSAKQKDFLQFTFENKNIVNKKSKVNKISIKQKLLCKKLQTAAMSTLLQNFKVLITKYPITRGMISYSLIWPVSSLVQQTFEGKTWGNYDWWRCLRFSLYGGLFVAPTLYGWIKVSSAMWPQTSIRTALAKAAVETISYTPGAMTCFYFIMSLLEMKTIEEAASEVRKKFLPTYKVGALVWPVVATINFSVIPEKNRVLFISVCSLIWTCFLAYMKHLQHHEMNEEDGFIVTKKTKENS